MEVEASSTPSVPCVPRRGASASPATDRASASRVDLSLCLQMLQRCKQLRAQLCALADPADPADPSEATLLKLELACLAHGDAAALQSFVQAMKARFDGSAHA